MKPLAPRREWYLLAGTLLLAVPLWLARGNPARAGSELGVAITLVGADRKGLECALPWAYERYRCTFQDDAHPYSPPPSEADRLQPVVTLDREVYLLPGLFLDPAVAAHVARNPAAPRFVARCTVRLLRKADGAKIRFSPKDRWQDTKEPAWMAVPVSCLIE